MLTEPVAEPHAPWWTEAAPAGDSGALERRAHERHVPGCTVRVSVGPQQSLPAATAHDVSPAGMLVAFDVPAGLVMGQRVLASVEVDGPGRLLLLGEVVRIERARDFRCYVAIAFDGGQPDVVAWTRALPHDLAVR